jgi:hypothetical protein
VIKTQVVASRQSFFGLVAQKNSALALENNFISQVWIFRKKFAKNGLRFAKAINVCVIEKIKPACECGFDCSASLFSLLGVQRRPVESAADRHAPID